MGSINFCLLKNLLAFNISGTFPIDLAKTRLQVQGQVGDSKYREIRYRGMLHAIMRIGREEGPRALYSGSVWGFDTHLHAHACVEMSPQPCRNRTQVYTFNPLVLPLCHPLS